MGIEIKRLSPELVDDYLYFFDVTPHDDDTEAKCYCVCWCSADHRVKTDFSSAEKRRELARQYVNNGIIQGYLAYQNEQVIGWCNANTKLECQNCISWLRSMPPVDNDELKQKIKSIFCFAIAPEMQRKGIATKLLERVCIDAKNDGFDVVESYPNNGFQGATRDFRGPKGMYEKQGFIIYKNINDKFVMRKQL